MQDLTKKQKQVFDFINAYREENGISPTIEEMRKKLKLRAVSTVHEHINTLKEKGYLSKNENSARGIVMKKESSDIKTALLFRYSLLQVVDNIPGIFHTQGKPDQPILNSEFQPFFRAMIIIADGSGMGNEGFNPSQAGPDIDDLERA